MVLAISSAVSLNVFAFYTSTDGTRWNSTCIGTLGVYNSNAQAATRIERGSGYPSDKTVRLYARIYDDDTCALTADDVLYSFDSSSAYENATVEEHTGYTSCSVGSSHAITNVVNDADEWSADLHN